MRDDQKLREQAAKARRLADGVSDPQTKNALTSFADEAEAQADAVEQATRSLLISEQKPGRGPGRTGSD